MFDLRLFRIPRFTTSLAVNFLTIFLAIGYFLFVAQYMQLVLGLTPLEAGLWSLPEAVGFIARARTSRRGSSGASGPRTSWPAASCSRASGWRILEHHHGGDARTAWRSS